MSFELEIDMQEALSQANAITQTKATQEEIQGENQQDTSSQIPDGIGLTIEQVQALISKHNNTHFPPDDPTMAIVTILNAFLWENQKGQESYMQALRQLFSDLTQAVNLEIKRTIEEVQSSLKTISITGLSLIHKEQTKEIERLRQHLFYACVFIAACTIFNIIALLWG